MTLFELMKIVLDGLYSEAKSAYKGKVDEVIGERMKYLSNSYKQLTSNKREPLDYRDPATRFAYVYKYVASHGDYIVQVLARLRTVLKPAIFTQEAIRLTCIGGGPGSDIIALLKYLSDFDESEPVSKVTCYLLDKENAWADTWTEIDESMEASVSLNVNFQNLDVKNPESWKYQRKFLQADLFTLSYFVSEVYSLDADGVVSSFWQELFASAKPGALFLYVDNGQDIFNNYFDKNWGKAKLECLLSETNTQWTPHYSEEKGALGEFLDKWESPKLKGYLSFRVLQKK